MRISSDSRIWVLDLTLGESPIINQWSLWLLNSLNMRLTIALNLCLLVILHWRKLMVVLLWRSLVIILYWGLLSHFILKISRWFLWSRHIRSNTNIWHVLFLLAYIHFIKIVIHMWKHLWTVFRSCIRYMSLIITAKLIMPLDLTSCNLIHHFLINIDSCSILVPLDPSIDVMGREWVSSWATRVRLVSKNVPDTLTLGGEFLQSVNPVCLPAV